MYHPNIATHPNQPQILYDHRVYSAPTVNVEQVIRSKAFVRILEQPASRAYRFRYMCEGKSAGSLPGANSTSELKTYPTIQIEGGNRPAVVIVSCVTAEAPFKAHPNNLVGKLTKNGVYVTTVSSGKMKVDFQHLGIHCVRKRDMAESMKVREQIKVDPFKQGFAHKHRPNTIDFGVVRLCFQVILEGSTPGKYTVPLDPVVSDPIYDKKSKAELSIVKMSHCVGYVDGGQEDIILLCDRVTKDDINVRFFEEENSEVVWEHVIKLEPHQIFKQCSIWFRSPPYRRLDIAEPVTVFLQLVRPSDGETSEPRPFQLLPSRNIPSTSKRMRRENDVILERIQEMPRAQTANNRLENTSKLSEEIGSNKIWNIALNDEGSNAQALIDSFEIDSDILDSLENKIVSGNMDVLPDIGNMLIST